MRRLLILGLPLIALVATMATADDDTAKAAATRKLLKHKVTVEFKDDAFRDVVQNLKDQVQGLSIKPDTKSGVQLNTKITLALKEVPLEDVLNAICEKNGWGYYIISKEKNAYDGQLIVKVGKERGYEEGKEPTAKDDKEPKSKGKAKTKEKAKAETKEKKEDKAEPKEKTEPRDPGNDEDRAERAAGLKLRTAKELVAEDKKDRAKKVLEDLLEKYPKTKAAEEAKDLLEKLKE